VAVGPLIASAVHLVQAQARTAGVLLEWPREQGILSPDWVRATAPGCCRCWPIC
jgi:hypothetical protein